MEEPQLLGSQWGLSISPSPGIEGQAALGLEASHFWDMEDKPAPSDLHLGVAGGLSSPQDLS